MLNASLINEYKINNLFFYDIDNCTYFKFQFGLHKSIYSKEIKHSDANYLSHVFSN